MANNEGADNEQARLWNGIAGHAWVDAQEVLDRMFEPFERLLVDAVAGTGSARVLDVGCGTGATTLAVARALPGGGLATGVDISEPMIALARTRAERERLPAQFVCADAQTYAFAPASVDIVVSRFGVMFFADPVAAFANLHRATAVDGAMRVIAWRSPMDNAFMTTAERAAAPLLPNLPPRDPDAPGQFAFADRARVHRILADSGWSAIDIQPIDVPCVLPEQELLPYLTRFGTVGRILPELPEPTRVQVIDRVRAAFEPYVHGHEVRYTAACWMIAARA